MTSRIIISQDPFISYNSDKTWRERGLWPCQWITCPEAGTPPFVTAYRLHFTLDEATATAVIPIHVTADERYELYLDGVQIGRGSERGDANNWFYESYELTAVPGAHVLAARVWSLGPKRPIAQMSVRPGFLLCAEGEWHDLLSTGTAAWQAKRLVGYQFETSQRVYWRGARIKVDGTQFPWGFEKGVGDGWQTAVPGEQAVGRVVDYTWHNIHRLQPATLPPMLDKEVRTGQVRHVAATDTAVPIHAAVNLPEEQPAWQTLLTTPQSSIIIPPNTRRRILFDLENYYCLYPELLVSGGAGSQIQLHSAESLYLNPNTDEKGHRDEIEGKRFVGIGDRFLPDGGDNRQFDTLWWQAGRYWELAIETAASALTIHRLTMRETRYPLEMESAFEASDGRLQTIMPMLERSMQMCSHETFYDAPYYEELMYAGDTRLEMLITYIMSHDDRLPRKAIRMYDSSRASSGLTQARYPSWETQVIPPFALYWVMMLHDYAYWRDDPAFVRRYLPGMRATLEAFQRFMDDDGLLSAPEGWNFMDWHPSWAAGIPPEALDGRNGMFNWLLAYTLTLAADLESKVGEPELAQLWQRRAVNLAQRATAAFFDESRGLLAEDEAKQVFTEHSQVLALLSGLLNIPHHAQVADGLLQAPDLLRATYYFSYYLFETYRLLGKTDAFLNRLQAWHILPDCGLKTTIEQPEPTRSDCHAWAAHPLFHYFTTILGIRPGSLGFRTVDILPQLGSLDWAAGEMMHPQGKISIRIKPANNVLRAVICLPNVLTGKLFLGEQMFPLGGGETMIEVPL